MDATEGSRISLPPIETLPPIPEKRRPREVFLGVFVPLKLLPVTVPKPTTDEGGLDLSQYVFNEDDDVDPELVPEVRGQVSYLKAFS